MTLRYYLLLATDLFISKLFQYKAASSLNYARAGNHFFVANIKFQVSLDKMDSIALVSERDVEGIIQGEFILNQQAF